MRITLVRDDGKVNTMRTLRIEQLVEQMKVETKMQPVSKMREVLPFMLPGDKNDYVQDIVSVYGVSEDEIKTLNREYKKILS
jgi:ssRNA-specific RNase YbeY (16S rRNA maturation enzyme)